MNKVIILIGILVVAVLAGYIFFNQLESTIAQQIEEQGRRQFGTQVQVHDVDINIKQGTAVIREISIANPPGYTQAHAMTLTDISASIDYKSLIIHEIIINQPHIFAELKNQKLNIAELINYRSNTQLAGQSGDEQTSTSANPGNENDSKNKDKEKDPIILTIDLIAMNNSIVSLQSDVIDDQKEFSIERLEARKLKGTTDQIGNQIVKSLFSDIYKRIVVESVKMIDTNQINELKEKAKEKLKGLFQ